MEFLRGISLMDSLMFQDTWDDVDPDELSYEVILIQEFGSTWDFKSVQLFINCVFTYRVVIHFVFCELLTCNMF